MKIEVNLGDLTEEKLAELCLAKLEASGKVLPPPLREEPYRVSEAAQALGVSKDAIYADLRSGALPKIPRQAIKRIPAWAIRVRQRGGDPEEEWERMKAEGFLRND